MILTCPQCANRYHVDRPLKTSEILAICPSCSHRWLSKVNIVQPLVLDTEKSKTVTQTTAYFEKMKRNKKIFIIISCVCIVMGYILQPLVKSAIESLFSLLKIQEVQKTSLLIENIEHSFDEVTQMVTVSWEVKNDMNVSENLKKMRIQLFSQCPKTQGDCLIKEVNFKSNKDIILPKEILRFEHTQKCSIPVTKIHIFP